MKQPYKLLILSPYEGFEQVFKRSIRDREDIDADFYSAPLKELPAVLKSIDVSPYEAMICRGRSAWEAAKLVNLPVITVEFSPIDILRGLELASLNREKKMAFVSFFDMEHTIRLIAEFMKLPFNRFLIPSSPLDAEDMRNLIYKLHTEQHVELFIGDGACTRAAREFGLEYVLITSGPESLTSAVDQAVEICRMRRSLEKENAFYRDAFFGLDEMVAVFSSEKELLSTNLPNTQLSTQILDSIQTHVSRIMYHGSISWILPTELSAYKIKGRQVELGGQSCVICNIDQAFKIDDQKLSYIKYKEVRDVQKDVSLITATPALNRYLQEIKEFAPGKTAVMITGSPGTGKISLARAIYAQSPLRTKPLVEIDCQGLDKRNLQRLLNEDHSPLYDQDLTIVLKNLDALQISFQQRLAEVFQSMELTKRNLFISTVSGSLKTLIPSNQLSSDLAYELNGYHVNIPELHEAPELAVSIAREYLNEVNQELPNQVAGFGPEALELLTHFHWNYGIPQFKLSIKQLAKAATGPFITEPEVRSVLDEFDDASNPELPSGHFCVDLHSDLETMTHQIVLKVLEEEEMNQTKAAQRLGVSRMTVWKHLKYEEDKNAEG